MKPQAILLLCLLACGESEEERWHAYPGDPRLFDGSHVQRCEDYRFFGTKMIRGQMSNVLQEHGRPQSYEMQPRPGVPADTIITLVYPGITYKIHHKRVDGLVGPYQGVLSADITSPEWINPEYIRFGTPRDSIPAIIVDHVHVERDSVVLNCGHEDNRPPIILYTPNGVVSRILMGGYSLD